jgi:transcriptional regulator with XRE-family HTH domain
MREARLRAGLSQRELGLRIGRPAPQIARWERGVVDPGFALVQRVMRACGFDLDERLVPWADEFRERLVVQPRGTLGFDRDLRRVSGREHLGAGPYDLVPLTPKTEERQAEELRLAGRGLRPVIAGSPDLVRMADATAGGRDDRLRELRRLAELETLSPH